MDNSKPIRKIDIFRTPDNVSNFVVGSVEKSDAASVVPSVDKPPKETSEYVVNAINRPTLLLNYCLNISDAASEARAAHLLKLLSDREEQVRTLSGELKVRIDQISVWMEKRELFIKQANGSLVSIFESMRSDAAALQLSAMDIGLAAAIIMKLKPRTSSGIMTEMRPEKAAEIASLMISAADDSELKQNNE